MLIGHLANDPDLRSTQNGTMLSNFPVITNREWKDAQGEPKQDSCYHRIIVWRKLAENCAKFLKKGSGVFIEGRLSQRKFEDKEGNTQYFTEIIADTVNFLRKPKEFLAPAN